MTSDPPTILLIEDEFLLRGSTAWAIEEAGYRVVAAAGGEEALRLVDERPVDLAIIDRVLPGGIDGLEFARAVHRRKPDLPLLFTSGKALVDTLAAAGMLGAVVTKPYTDARLLDAIARQLGRPCSEPEPTAGR